VRKTSIVRKNLLFFLTVAAYIAVFIADKNSFFHALSFLKMFVLEMIQVLPFVLFLAALISEWIPAKMVQKSLGEASGFQGVLFSILLGSISAGPIYAAFPVCLALYRKGASIRNLAIVISSWAVIKVPMLFMELKFLGPEFTGIRYLLTLPAILLLGYLMDRMIKPVDIKTSAEFDKPILLPGKNCGTCGFASCADLKQFAGGNTEILKRKCPFLN